MCNGVIEGVKKEWDENGNLILWKEYCHSICFRYKKWDSEGNLLEEQKEPSKTDLELFEVRDRVARDYKEQTERVLKIYKKLRSNEMINKDEIEYYNQIKWCYKSMIRRLDKKSIDDFYDKDNPDYIPNKHGGLFQ